MTFAIKALFFILILIGSVATSFAFESTPTNYFSNHNFQIYKIKEKHYEFFLPYNITSSKIQNMTVDCPSQSMIINLAPVNTNGTLTVSLPRSLLDVKTQTGDDNFVTLVNGVEVNHLEIEKNQDARTLSIPFTVGVIQIEIIGVSVGQEQVPVPNSCGIGGTNESPYYHLLSPLEQFRSGVSANEIQCKSGLVLIQKHGGFPACVQPQTAQKLVERGWGLQVTPKAWFEFKQTITSHDDCKNIPWIRELIRPNPSQQMLMQSMTNTTLIADYFKNHEVTLLQVKYDLGNIVSNPISMCGYPTYYFHVSQNDTSKMIGLGYTPVDEKDVQRACSLNNRQVIK